MSNIIVNIETAVEQDIEKVKEAAIHFIQRLFAHSIPCKQLRIHINSPTGTNSSLITVTAPAQAQMLSSASEIAPATEAPVNVPPSA